MSEVAGHTPEQNFDPEQRIIFAVPTEEGAEIQIENALAVMAQNQIQLIRMFGESLGEQRKTDLLRKAIHVDPKLGRYGSLEYNAWTLHALTEEERTIALSSVDDELKETLLKKMDEVLIRDKAYQERVQKAARAAQPLVDKLFQEIRNRMQAIDEQEASKGKGKR